MYEALAWASKWEGAFVTPYAPKRLAALVEIYNEHIQATAEARQADKDRYEKRTAVLLEREARHAAEMQELKEQFSEAAKEAHESLNGYSDFSPAGRARKILAHFIIPAPDVVSEWLSECSDGRVSDHTKTILRLFHNWLSEKETRKIGEAWE